MSSVEKGILPPPGHASHERVLAILARQDALKADYQASLHARAERDQEGEPLQERQQPQGREQEGEPPQEQQQPQERRQQEQLQPEEQQQLQQPQEPGVVAATPRRATRQSTRQQEMQVQHLQEQQEEQPEQQDDDHFLTFAEARRQEQRQALPQQEQQQQPDVEQQGEPPQEQQQPQEQRKRRRDAGEAVDGENGQPAVRSEDQLKELLGSTTEVANKLATLRGIMPHGDTCAIMGALYDAEGDLQLACEMLFSSSA